MHRAVYDRRFGQRRRMRLPQVCDYSVPCSSKPDMGLAPGGRMRQEIYADAYGLADWDRSQTSRCFVHIANSVTWRAITGEQPPTKPLTAQQYTKAGLSWFDYYAADQKALEGAAALGGLKSVAGLAAEKRKAFPDKSPWSPRM